MLRDACSYSGADGCREWAERMAGRGNVVAVRAGVGEDRGVRDVTREMVLGQFRWVGGHADLWGVFRDGEKLRAVVDALVEPFRGAGVTAVCGIESRGFLLGGAAAIELGVGFVAVRKEGGMFPGEKLTTRSAPDYRGIRQVLRLQRDSLRTGDRVLLVDDWIETGSQARAVAAMVAEAGAEFVGCAVIVDELSADFDALGKVHSLVTGGDLPDE